MAAAIGGQCAGAARGGVTGALREAMPPGRGAQYGWSLRAGVKGENPRWCSHAPHRRLRRRARSAGWCRVTP